MLFYVEKSAREIPPILAFFSRFLTAIFQAYSSFPLYHLSHSFNQSLSFNIFPPEFKYAARKFGRHLYYIIFPFSLRVNGYPRRLNFSGNPLQFKRILSYSICYSVVIFAFRLAIMQTLFVLLPFQSRLELPAITPLRANRFQNREFPYCSFFSSTLCIHRTLLIYFN